MELLDLDQHALERHGLVVKTTSGIPERTWYRMLHRGDLEALHPGVARLAGTPRTYIQRRWGIRCTNQLRTLVDLGAVAPGLVSDALGHLLSTREIDLDAVAAALLDHGRRGRAGVGTLRKAVDDWSIDAKLADSVLETAFARLVARYELPPYDFHPVIEGWEVDFRFRSTNVVVECDGWTTHGLDRHRFERDRRRDDDLTAAGWLVRRFTYRAITTQPGDTARRIRRALATSRPR